jgi:hypothetical protein
VKNHRFAVTGLVVFAAASLALAGCSASSKTTDNPTAGASTSASAPAPDATAALTAALAGLTTSGFDFTETSGVAGGDMLNATGTIDVAKKAASLTGKGTAEGANIEIDVVEVSPAVYAKIDLGTLNASVGLPNTWMSLDPTKIKSGGLPVDLTQADLLDLAGLFASVTNAAYSGTDPSTITGTVDLTKATGATAPDVSAYASQAAATPFTAKLDSAGHLAALTIDTTAYDKSSNLAFAFSNVGSPSAVTAPTGATPAPDAVYSFLSGS